MQLTSTCIRFFCANFAGYGYGFVDWMHDKKNFKGQQHIFKSEESSLKMHNHDVMFVEANPSGYATRKRIKLLKTARLSAIFFDSVGDK